MKRINHLPFLAIICTIILLFTNITVCATSPKREFRGVWIQCVNGQFQGMSPDRMMETLSHQLDVLKADGVNAVIFQVRAECDALYASSYEPWSRFLTGVQGQAPSPYWDPLAWMITECHKRGIELHAWINPFRAKTKGTTVLADNHIALKHPERVFSYDGQFILNPGLKENRDYICKIVSDIVSRYDIDGLHIDDYFYPYPVAGMSIPDNDTYNKNGNGISNKNDWRRWNVNQVIKELYTTVHKIKPWVKFGVSPFGIWRNKTSDPALGSDTHGLQNYDDLYADVLLWINNGWVDYVAPQLYWEIGNHAADYETLIRWWNAKASLRPLFIGEDVERTIRFSDPSNQRNSQIEAKQRLHSEMNNVEGSVLWYAVAVVEDKGKYGSSLRNVYWRYPALQPLMPFIDDFAPRKPRNLKPVWTKDGYMLFWRSPKANTWKDQAVRYVVYRFNKGESINIDDVTKIVDITTDTYLKLPYINGKTKFTYVVTSLDRMSNESKLAKKKVKL